jgi:hypothetical protein
MLSDNEQRELTDDIKLNGLREPIWLFQGKILDGRNRYKSCWELGIVPATRKYKGDDPVAFVISMNLKRRHLDVSQRSMLASRLANMRQGERTDKEPSAKLRKVSQSKAAEQLKVSERTVQQANKVFKDAIPEVIAAVDTGTIAVSVAALLAQATPEQQREVIAKGDKRAIVAATKALQSKAAEQSADTVNAADVPASSVVEPDTEPTSIPETTIAELDALSRRIIALVGTLDTAQQSDALRRLFKATTAGCFVRRKLQQAFLEAVKSDIDKMLGGE